MTLCSKLPPGKPTCLEDAVSLKKGGADSQQSFQRIYERHGKEVAYWAVRDQLQDADIRDLTQDLWLSVYFEIDPERMRESKCVLPWVKQKLRYAIKKFRENPNGVIEEIRVRMRWYRTEYAPSLALILKARNDAQKLIRCAEMELPSEVVQVLRVFLECDGKISQVAETLGVSRHRAMSLTSYLTTELARVYYHE